MLLISFINIYNSSFYSNQIQIIPSNYYNFNNDQNYPPTTRGLTFRPVDDYYHLFSFSFFSNRGPPVNSIIFWIPSSQFFLYYRLITQSIFYPFQLINSLLKLYRYNTINQNLPQEQKQHILQMIQLLNNSSQPESYFFQSITTQQPYETAMIEFDNLNPLKMKTISDKNVRFMSSQPMGYRRDKRQYFIRVIKLFSRIKVKRLLISNQMERVTNDDLYKIDSSFLSTAKFILIVCLGSFLMSLFVILYFHLSQSYFCNDFQSHIHQQFLLRTMYSIYPEEFALWLIGRDIGILKPQLEWTIISYGWLPNVYKFICFYSLKIVMPITAGLSYLYYQKVRKQNHLKANIKKFKSTIQQLGGPLKIMD